MCAQYSTARSATSLCQFYWRTCSAFRASRTPLSKNFPAADNSLIPMQRLATVISPVSNTTAFFNSSIALSTSRSLSLFFLTALTPVTANPVLTVCTYMTLSFSFDEIVFLIHYVQSMTSRKWKNLHKTVFHNTGTLKSASHLLNVYSHVPCRQSGQHYKTQPYFEPASNFVDEPFIVILQSHLVVNLAFFSFVTVHFSLKQSTCTTLGGLHLVPSDFAFLWLLSRQEIFQYSHRDMQKRCLQQLCIYNQHSASACNNTAECASRNYHPVVVLRELVYDHKPFRFWYIVILDYCRLPLICNHGQ